MPSAPVAAVRDDVPQPTDRIVQLLAEMQALAVEGRPPSLHTVRAFLSTRKVSQQELTRLMAAAAAGTNGEAVAAVGRKPVHDTDPDAPRRWEKRRDGSAAVAAVRPDGGPRPCEGESLAPHVDGPPNSYRGSETRKDADTHEDPGVDGHLDGSDDLDGMDDPFAVQDPKPLRLTSPVDPAARAVEDLVHDLVDDFARAGHLTRAQISLAVSRRGMGLVSIEKVLTRLDEAGIDIDEDAPRRGYDGRYDLDGGRARRQVGSESLDSVASYLRQVGRYPLLNAADEQHLAAVIAMGEQARQGLFEHHHSPQEDARLIRAVRAGQEARDRFTCANLRLVISIARLPRYTSSGLDLGDLIQEGNSGLMHAVTKFNGTLGYKFSTYATWWIKQALLRGIADKGRTIRIPVHMHDKLSQLRQERHRLGQVLNRTPTVEELAERLDKAPAQVAAMLDYLQPVLSLDAPTGDEGDTALVDLLAQDEDHDGRYDPVELALATDRQFRLMTALQNVLSDRDLNIMVRRYGLDHEGERTLDDIGKDVGVTRERIRQIVTKSLARLSEDPAHHHLYEYLFDDLGDEFDMTALFAERSGEPCAQERLLP